MMPDAQSLSEVVVKGTKPVVRSTVDGLQYIVGNDEFAKGMNGEELMGRVPMLDVKPDPNGGMAVSIVGKSSTHFLINGKTLPGNILQSKLKSLRSEDIERVEVMTIPSAKYAAEGNAGYINIITKKDDVYGFKGNISGSVNSKEHVNYSVAPTINYVSPKVEVSFGANARMNKLSNDRDNVFSFTDGHQRTESHKNYLNWDIYTANGLIKYYPIKGLEFGAQAGVSNFHMKSSAPDIINDNNVITSTLSNSPYYPNFMLSAEAYADWKIDSVGKDLMFTYDYTNNYELHNDTLRSTTNEVLTGIANKSSSHYRLDSWKLDLTLPYDKLKMAAGLAYTNLSNNSWNTQYNNVDDGWAINEDLSSKYRYRERTAAAYASAGYEFSDAVSTNVGLRLERTWLDGTLLNTGEKHNDNYTHLFPSIHFLWNMPKAGSLSLEYSMGINRPTFQDLNPFRIYSSSKSYASGNPYLMPSITHNFGLAYNNNKGLYAFLYENHESNGISYISTFDTDGMQALQGVNCVTSDKVGLNVSYNKDIFTWWNIIIGGDFFYSSAHSTTHVADIPSVHGWSVELEANSTWFLDKAHKLAFNMYYAHYFPHYEGISKMETLALFWGGLRYSLLNDRLNLNLNFDDPFNQNIIRTTVKYATYTNIQKFEIHQRSISLSVTWNFGGNKVKGVYHESKNTESGRL